LKLPLEIEEKPRYNDKDLAKALNHAENNCYKLRPSARLVTRVICALHKNADKSSNMLSYRAIGIKRL
jgi:hypothetical protein